MVRFASFIMLAVGVGGCGGAGAQASDAGDAWYFPRDTLSDAGAAGDAADGPSHDVAPTVDVVVFDSNMPRNEVGVQDASADSAAARCAMVDESYAQAVHDAQTCSSDSDCSVAVCETLCCNCRVFVNASAPSYGALMELEHQWSALGCASEFTCVAMTCDPPASAQCSSTHRCVTIRQVGGSG